MTKSQEHPIRLYQPKTVQGQKVWLVSPIEKVQAGPKRLAGWFTPQGLSSWFTRRR